MRATWVWWWSLLHDVAFDSTFRRVIYVVRLNLPDAEAVVPVNVAVLKNQTAQATLVMSTSSVRLTVIIPSGRSKDLLIEPTSDRAGINGRIRSTVGMGSEDRCSFDFVRPGDYRLSLDGNAWTTISIGPSPTEQAIDFLAMVTKS